MPVAPICAQAEPTIYRCELGALTAGRLARGDAARARRGPVTGDITRRRRRERRLLSNNSQASSCASTTSSISRQ
jgi:hypothetical protein